MAKRRRIQNIEKFIKEGKGQGQFENYKPWLTIQDVPSLGRVTRLKGIKTKRQHEFLSDLERDFFYYLEYSDIVIDIREQFPLLPLDETILIADELGIKHPKDPRTGENIVMTTDFLITINKKATFHNIARTIKPKENLSKRVIEKFNIEREYWKRKNIDWGIVTDNEIDKVVALNISSFHNYYDIDNLDSFHELDKNHINKLILLYLNSLLTKKESINIISRKFDESNNLLVGTGLSIFKYLLARKIIKLDLSKKLNYQEVFNGEIIDIDGMV